MGDARRCLRLAFALLAGACGDDGGGDDGATDASATSSASSGDSTSGASASATASTGASGSASESGGGESATDTSGEGTSATTGEAVACGEIECAPGQYCVQPCCGGPSPACDPVETPECPDGTHEVDCGQCSSCRGDVCPPGTLCCEDDPCVPPAAYCVDAADVVCEQPSQSCDEPCMGQLFEGVISCEDCA